MALVFALRDESSIYYAQYRNQRKTIIRSLLQHSLYISENTLVTTAPLKTRKKKVGETLQEFETDLRKLTHLAHPSAPAEVIELIATQNFIRGVRYDTVRSALLLTTYTTTRKPVGRALGVEAAHKATAANCANRRRPG